MLLFIPFVLLAHPRLRRKTSSRHMNVYENTLLLGEQQNELKNTKKPSEKLVEDVHAMKEEKEKRKMKTVLKCCCGASIIGMILFILKMWIYSGPK